MMNDGCDLPEHVLFDILLWLPVASLLRFKSVCKVWFALIGSSSFITEHLSRSNNTENALIVHAIERADVSKANFMLIHGKKYQKWSKLDHMQVLITCDGSWFNYRLVGCCDGIVCVRTADFGNLALCNPAMKQIKYLPRPSFPTPPAEEVSRFDGWVVYGFGFDFKTNDYKVVRVLVYAGEPGSGHYNMKIVEVYSKRANSWRTLHREGASLPFKFIAKYPQATNKDDTCFWIGLGFDDADKLLVSFNFSDEVFGMISLPSLPNGELKDNHGLDILNGKLVYMNAVESDIAYFDETGKELRCRCFHECGDKIFDIWMLQEFGVDGSWNKIYRIGPIFQKGIYPSDHGSYYCPIRLLKNGESVVLIEYVSAARQTGELRLYNIRIQDNQLPLLLPEDYLAYEVFHYCESLVSV